MSSVPRSHPWTVSKFDAEHRYIDFKANPELMEASLEDFKTWSGYGSVQEFYEFLRGINGPKSALETNDCAFRGPHANTDPAYPKQLWCNGRVMVLFRDLPLNTSKETVRWLEEGVQHWLGYFCPDLEWAAVGTTIMAAEYASLPGAPQGYQLKLSFFAWGDTEEETMASFGQVVLAISNSLIAMSQATEKGLYRTPPPEAAPPSQP
jgi:hypothetical protein